MPVCEKLLLNSLKIDKSHAQTKFQLAKIYSLLGNYSSSNEILTELESEMPGNAFIFAYKHINYRELGEKSEADRYFAMAIEIEKGITDVTSAWAGLKKRVNVETSFAVQDSINC